MLLCIWFPSESGFLTLDSFSLGVLLLICRTLVYHLYSSKPWFIHWLIHFIWVSQLVKGNNPTSKSKKLSYFLKGVIFEAPMTKLKRDAFAGFRGMMSRRSTFSMSDRWVSISMSEQARREEGIRWKLVESRDIINCLSNMACGKGLIFHTLRLQPLLFGGRFGDHFFHSEPISARYKCHIKRFVTMSNFWRETYIFWKVLSSRP